MTILFYITMAILGFVMRLSYIMYNIHHRDSTRKKRTKAAKTMVVLGSGGHTSEMLRLLQNTSPQNYTPLIHIIATTDSTSSRRVMANSEKTTRQPDATYLRLVERLLA